MKKIVIISILVAVLALGGVGAAYATGMNFSNVQALSLGEGAVPQINCTGVVYALGSSSGVGVAVTGVQVKFDTALNDAAVSISLRDASNNELAYYAANGVTLAAGTYSGWLGLLGEDNTVSTLPSPASVYYVKVTAANDSAYNPSITNFGPGTYTGP